MNVRVSKPRGWMITSGASACVVVYVLCGFIPGQKSIASLRKDLQTKRQFVANVDLERTTLRQLEQQQQFTQAHVDRWRQAAPQDPGLVSLLGRIAALAEDARVSLQRLTPHEPVMLDAIQQHPLELELEGDFSQVVDFLSKVEELPQTIWIKQLNLLPARQDGAIVQCKLALCVFTDNRKNSD